MPPQPKGTTDTTAGLGTSAVGLNLYNTDGTLAGQLVRIEDGLFLKNPERQLLPIPFTGGNYLVDAGGGDLFQFSINSEGGVIKSGTSTPPTGGTAPAFSGTSAGLAQQAQQDLDFLREQERLARERGDIDAARDLENQIAILERQQAFALEQDEANQRFQAEQNRLAEEAAQKRQRLGVLSDLVQGFIGAQQSARETLATLAPDPFALAAGINMMPMFGTSPQQAFQGTLENFVNQPIPQVGPNATLPQIGQAISTATGLQAPPLPASQFGLAGGGVVPFGPPESFLVGEAGPEVMTVGPQGVQVTPLKGGFQEGGFVAAQETTHPLTLSAIYQALLGRSTFFGSQIREAFKDIPIDFIRDIGFGQFSTIIRGTAPARYGGTLRAALSRLDTLVAATPPAVRGVPPPPTPPVQPDVSSLRQALAPIFSNLGFSEVPMFSRGPRGALNLPDPSILSGASTGADILSTLGIAPNLVRDPSGAIFFVDRQANTLRHIPSQDLLTQLGGIESSINLGAAGIAGLGFGMGAPLTSLPSAIGGGGSAFGPVSPNILFEPESNTILPAPFKIASLLNRFDIQNNPNLTNILSGFKSAGFAPGTVMSRAQAAVPTGLGRSIIGLR